MKDLADMEVHVNVYSGRRRGPEIQIIIECHALLLALRAEMGSPPGQHDPPDGHFAVAAGEAGAQINAMLELKKTAYASRIDIIGNRRATQPNGMLQHLAKRQP